MRCQQVRLLKRRTMTISTVCRYEAVTTGDPALCRRCLRELNEDSKPGRKPQGRVYSQIQPRSA